MKKFDNFCAALKNLKEIYAYEEPFGIIKDEDIWLEALATRNNVEHAYNEVIAIDIVRNTKAKYYNMFCKLKEEVEDNWKF